jgi:hypothetical protein
VSVTHPLNAADAERSKARLADIELGLAAGDDLNRSYWRDKLDERIRLLEEDEPIYGLLPHEIEELAALKALRGETTDPSHATPSPEAGE